jgi:uncharacterized alkaline shock family protein YloU
VAQVARLHAPWPGHGGWAGRFVRGLALVALAALAAAGFVVAIGVVDLDSIGFAMLAGWVDGLGVTARATIAVASVAVGIGATAALVHRRSVRDEISTRHLIGLAVTAEVRVTGRGSEPVDLRVRVTTLPGTTLPRIGEAAQAAARDAAEQLAGLEVRQVHVELAVESGHHLDRLLE